MSKLQSLLRFIAVIAPCSLLFAPGTYAQRFGNEWIVNNQQYYKIPVGEDGIYQLDYITLQQVGFPVASVDPRRIQIFFRGTEQAIEVRGQQDARFNEDDYIRFYGQRNDGTLDAELYEPSEAQPHPHYNLYSDTTAYFLTWRLDAGVGLRATTFSENNVSSLPAESYHLHQEQLILAEEYSQGRLYPIGSASSATTRLSSFDYGEGWTGQRVKQGESVDYTIPVASAQPSGPQPQIQLVLTGRNNQQHNVTVQVGSNAGSLRTLTTAEFSYYDSYQIDEPLEWSDLGSSQMTVRLTVNGVDGKADNISLAFLKVIYARQFNAENQNRYFNLLENTNSKSYLEVTNPPANAQLWDITNPNTPEVIGYNNNAGVLSAIAPNTNLPRQLYLAEVRPMFNVEKISLAPLETSARFLIVGHTALRQPAGAYSDPIKAYYDYRVSTGHQPLLVNINQLYNQFSYGEITPLAIRRFADYMLSVGNPEFLLLIGKGLTVNYNYHRRDPSTFQVHDYIPSGGVPGSDIVFTAGLAGSDGTGAAIPTGRINANTARHVANYLDKVKETESRTLAEDYEEEITREALWKKHLVHLSGGVSAFELSLYARYVDNFAAIAENNFLGGKVATQTKKTNNATELINIADEVNKGISLITFFGHSSTTVTDIDIGFVSNDELGYRNQGKYPAILLNGCNAGNVFSNTLTFGEDWIRTEDRGALHVMAHSSLGISNVLKQYSDRFYEVAFGDSAWIDRSLGAIKQESERKFLEQLGASAWEMHTSQIQQMVLQGDPSVALFGRGKPDYEINTDNIFVTPLQDGPVTAASDSFAINCVVRNFGRTQTDSLALSVQRTFSDGSTAIYGPIWYSSVLYQDTLQFTVPNQEGNLNSGNNQLEVIIDSPDSVAELNESNNRAIIDYFVPISGTANVFPANYGIVSADEVTLQVQPGNLQTTLRSATPRAILVELDTSVNFNSSLRQQTSLETTALAQWRVTLPLTQDSTVYFWRSKYASPQAGEVEDWNINSFVYLSNSNDGWAQTHPTQWKENTIINLSYQNEQWIFDETSISIEVAAAGADGVLAAELLLNGILYTLTEVDDNRLLCESNGIGAVAFTQNGLLPYAVITRAGFDLQNPYTCGRRPQLINTFNNGEITGANRFLEQYVEGVGDNDPVLLFSSGNVDYTAWPTETLNKLQEIGVDVTALGDLQAGEPLIILGRKNAEAGSAIIVRADSTNGVPVSEQVISLNEQITEQYRSGSIQAKRIGPARRWQELRTNILGTDYSLIVLGETSQGEIVTLLDGITGQPVVNLSGIDAQQYPYLRLQLDTEDPTERTPAQLASWIVLYETLPEGTLISVDVSETITEKQEGQELTVRGEFYNLSGQDFADSLAVVYTILNQERRQSEVDTLYVPAPVSQDTSSFTIPVDTRGRIGTNDLTIQVNPQQQLEQTYTNNVLRIDDWLHVIGDETNPIVDVAFDGVYIMDGDIVAPNPLITIELRDENPYLQKQDTAGIEILLGKIETTANASISSESARTQQNDVLKRVSLDQPNVTWSPASEENPFTVTYQPEALEDGLYRLQVQANDASGNASGVNPYEITFEVINASTITHFYPYPNPFSTSTRFVFTLTGAEVPDQLKIQIMTVSGKIVREITQDEIGPIRIGNNITQYAWDGRDEYGDELANGVYLYRVIVRNDGQAIEHRETSADRAFKQNFGKLYILR